MIPGRKGYVWFLETFRLKGRGVLFSSIYGAPKKPFLSIAMCEELKEKERSGNKAQGLENGTNEVRCVELYGHKGSLI